MMEYWMKHVRSKALGVVLRMFGVEEPKADQVSHVVRQKNPGGTFGDPRVVATR